MNKENMRLAIQILRENRAGAFDYTRWIEPNHGHAQHLISTDDLHRCNTTVCAGGYIAADSRTPLQLRPFGISANIVLPGFDHMDELALAQWLDIPDNEAYALFIDAHRFFPETIPEDITADHVIQLLEHYLEHGDLSDFPVEA